VTPDLDVDTHDPGPFDSPDAEPRPPSFGVRREGAGLMVLASCGFLALSVVYMESALVRGVPGRVVADLAFLIPLVLGTVLCFVASRRSSGVEARFWTIAAVLNAVLLASEIYWVTWLMTQGSPPPAIYAPFQMLGLAAALLGIALLAAMVRMADTPAPLQVRWWLDLAALATVVYVVCLRFYIDPVLVGVQGVSAADRLIAAAYPTWGAMMVGGALWILVRPGMMRWRLWERFIAASIVIYAAGMVLWPFWLASFQVAAPGEDRSVLDLVLILGHCLFSIAAAERLIHTDRAWPMRKLGPERSVTGRLATYLALCVTVVALPLLVVAAVVAPVTSSDRVPYIVGALLVAVLAVARTIVSAIENGRLLRTSVSDPVTGLRNHTYFHEHLADGLAAAARYGESVAVVWLDIDDFERFNRLAGHAAGDERLRAIATTLTSCCSERDILCRVGGDEFAVIVSAADPADVEAMVGRLVVGLGESAFAAAAAPTVSGGIACYPQDGDDPIALADSARRAAVWAHGHEKGAVVRYDARIVGEARSDEALGAFEERTRLGTLRALAVAVDARREASGTRSSAVAALSTALARQLGLHEERVALVETAALVHDVGMVAIGDDILSQPDRLTEEQMALVRLHPALAEQIVGASAPPVIVPWIRHHHEWWNGEGYPDGLRAVAIPLESRIIAVCDAWDAMTSERPFRRAMSATQAVAELRACAGTQFDPELVEPFVVLAEAFYRS
jgi:diguanylate cyclase (GGDEF)-like protein